MKNQVITEYKEQTRKEIIAQKAQLIARSGMVTKVGVNHWRVQSSSDNHPGLMYDVLWDTSLEILTCSCPHFEYRLEYCKHIVACCLFEGQEGVQ